MRVLKLSTDSGESLGRVLAVTLANAANANAVYVELDPTASPTMSWWSAFDVDEFDQQLAVPIDFPKNLAVTIRDQFICYDDRTLDDLSEIGELEEFTPRNQLPKSLESALMQFEFVPLLVGEEGKMCFWNARTNQVAIQFWRFLCVCFLTQSARRRRGRRDISARLCRDGTSAGDTER